MGEKHLAQLVGEGACQPDIFTKYRLGCELSYVMSYLFVCFVTLVIQGVVCIYITYILYCATKWPIPRNRELDFGPEFERNGSNECEIVNEGSSKPIRCN